MTQHRGSFGTEVHSDNLAELEGKRGTLLHLPGGHQRDDLLQDCQVNLGTTKRADFEEVRRVFEISQTSISNQKDERFGISAIEWKTIPWMITISLQDRAVNLSKAHVHVYSESVFKSWENG